MSKEVPCHSVGGSHSELLLNTLKSRYPCFHDPLTLPAADATPDNDDYDDDDGDKIYLPSLWVFGNRQVDGPESPLPPSVKPRAKIIVPHNQKIVDPIESAIKSLSFREERVLVQFWSLHDDGKHQLLTTKDQPFRFGVIDDGLFSYRKYSEHITFPVDKDHQEYNVSPPARVFSRGIPEWISDLNNYNRNDFPQQECAIRCKFHGYLALPVFDSTTGLCVGVLELLMSSLYMSFDYEVQQVHRELKKEKLTSPKAFSFPFSMASEAWQNDMDQILKAFRIVCGTHSLPLAQTWAASPSTSLVSHEQVIGKSCNSFHTRCVGKFCLSTAGLPFHVQDLGKWSFREASRKQHLESPRGVVGRAFSTQDSCYCVDVTKLSEEEYPLVHYAHISKLTGCFAIFLQTDNSNHKYVLEFFLPGHVKDCRYLSSVVQTLKENMVASGFELGDKSIIQTSSNEMVEMGDNFSCCTDSFCSEQSVTSIAGTDCANVVSPTHMSMENTCAEFTDDVAKSNLLKEARKRKRDSDIVSPVTRKVIVKATFNENNEEFQFCIPSELSNLENEVVSNLKNEVAKRFKLMGNVIDLKYYDEENDLILICYDNDVEYALFASRSNDTISLIVKIKDMRDEMYTVKRYRSGEG